MRFTLSTLKEDCCVVLHWEYQGAEESLAEIVLVSKRFGPLVTHILIIDHVNTHLQYLHYTYHRGHDLNQFCLLIEICQWPKNTECIPHDLRRLVYRTLWQIDDSGLKWPMVLAMVTVHPLPHHMGKWQGKEIYWTKGNVQWFWKQFFPAQRQKCFEDKLNFTTSQTYQESDLSFIYFSSFNSLDILFQISGSSISSQLYSKHAGFMSLGKKYKYANLYESVGLVHIRPAYSYIMNMTQILRLPNWPYWVCTIQTDVNQPTDQSYTPTVSQITFGSAETTFHIIDFHFRLVYVFGRMARKQLNASTEIWVIYQMVLNLQLR